MSNKDVNYLSDDYKVLRPSYPDALYDILFGALETLQSASGIQSTPKVFDLAVDVATGTGQVVKSLTSRFKRILATDKLTTQIGAAESFPNVTYECRDAADTGLPNGSADLVTVGQAIHWFDVEAFYREAIRVLKPGSGVLAFWTYDFGTLDEAGSDADLEFAKIHRDVLGPYWLPGMWVAMSGYKDLKPDVGAFFEQTERHELQMGDVCFNAQQMAAYVRTWSGYVAFREKNPDLDPAEDFFKALTRIVEARRTAAATPEEAAAADRFVNRRRLTLVIAHGPK